MKKTSKNYIFAVSIAILGLVWLVSVIAYTRVFELPQLGWGSIVCTAAAVVAAELYILVFRKDPGEQGLEPGALGTVLTSGFLLMEALLNGVFVLLKRGGFSWLLFTLNLIVFAGYIILLLWVEQSNAKLAGRLAETAQKTASFSEISRKLGELLAITEDAEIRKELLKLKEAVDYSTNISTSATAASEARMNEQLDELVRLMNARADRLAVLQKINAAEMTWKMRNNTASSLG